MYGLVLVGSFSCAGIGEKTQQLGFVIIQLELFYEHPRQLEVVLFCSVTLHNAGPMYVEKVTCLNK